MAYRMILNETSYFGPGSIRCIVDEVKKRGFKKALVVTDKDLIRFDVATRVFAILDGAGLPYSVFDEVVPNPTIEVVQQGVEAFKQSGADYLIAIGGGSPQDTCKAIGICRRSQSRRRGGYEKRRRTDDCHPNDRRYRGGSHHQLRNN